MNYIFNKKVDFLFIQFPIFFPLIYLTILTLLPNFEIYLIFFSILILAEPHFGATWTIFFSKKNNAYFKTNKFLFYYSSIILVLFCLIGYFYFKSLFFLIFYAFNIFHVTRQSIGITKLYNKDGNEVKIQLNFID